MIRSPRASRLALLALALASAAAFAATTGDGTSAHARLDANNDGAIDRAEAAAHPRLAEHFDQLDRNRDGRLSADERPQWRGHDGRGHGHERLERLDADADGRISRAELGPDAKLASRFAEIDANHDGYLVRSEVRAWHERMRPQRQAVHARHAAELFAAADLNRDGKLSRVEVDEKMPRLARGFAWMDDNRDGFLSREELHHPRGR